MLNGFPIKPAASVALFAFVTAHSLVPCGEDMACPKVKGVAISISASAGTSTAASDTFLVQNPIAGAPLSAKPHRNLDWFQKG